jgi:hypothetical protein
VFIERKYLHWIESNMVMNAQSFFHVMATVNFRRNAMTQLKDGNVNMVQDHESKAALL